MHEATAPQTTTVPDLRPVVTPFTIAVDTREQQPYQFDNLRCDADKKLRPLKVVTKTTALASGDYSIVGLESRVCVERKSLSDLFSTIGSGIDRFRREHERMAEYDHAVVIVEADIDTVLAHPPRRSRMEPKAVFRLSTKWAMRYGVHWRFVGVPWPEYLIRCWITERGIEAVGAELGVAFFNANGPVEYEQRIKRLIEALRARESRKLAEQVTFRTLEAFFDMTKEKEKQDAKSQRKHERNAAVGAGTGTTTGATTGAIAGKPAVAGTVAGVGGSERVGGGSGGIPDDAPF